VEDERLNPAIRLRLELSSGMLPQRITRSNWSKNHKLIFPTNLKHFGTQRKRFAHEDAICGDASEGFCWGDAAALKQTARPCSEELGSRDLED
jgi:hypothetical protein